MTEEAHSGDRGRRVAQGERLSGFIYGTIIVLSVVSAGAKAFPEAAGHVAALVAGTVVVLWLAHVYAHGLGQSVARDERLSLAELRHIARREASIVEAGLLPVAALVLHPLGLASAEMAVWIAVAAGVGVLVAQGVAFGRVERLGRLRTLLVVALNLGLGLLLIGLKLAFSY